MKKMINLPWKRKIKAEKYQSYKEEMEGLDRMRTSTGKLVPILTLQPEDVELEDIAHSLAMQCRFNGHCPFFFSVAEHCMIVADLLPLKYAIYGLLHDAHKTYLGDITYPVKNALGSFADCRPDALCLNRICGSLDKAIMQHFNLSYDVFNKIHDLIKSADEQALEIEFNTLFNTKQTLRQLGGNPPANIHGYSPMEAKEMFIFKFHQLYAGNTNAMSTMKENIKKLEKELDDLMNLPQRNEMQLRRIEEIQRTLDRLKNQEESDKPNKSRITF